MDSFIQQVEARDDPLAMGCDENRIFDLHHFSRRLVPATVD